ncbi:hypothetical protein E2C01_041178 [Portunus trituberculatus]|uniref:Uncharacterized protein n=1 Tax=Portunus trituberculatus TaxID=210409 RepID=A0A5B7FJC0_PORTR|nr:hypothetical protein [Portunus trituberculatus]
MEKVPSGLHNQDSDEVLEDPLDTPASYPFKEKEFQVDDFILVAIVIEDGRNEKKVIHYVGKILGIEEDWCLAQNKTNIQKKSNHSFNIVTGGRYLGR